MGFDSSTHIARHLTEWPSGGVVVIFDTEFTAWDGSQARNWSEPWEAVELVEIGAVRVEASTFAVLDTFQVLVLPKKNPVLSEYFTNLTGITQIDLDEKGMLLPVAIANFEKFCESASAILSNGGDAEVFVESFRYYGLPCPIDFGRYLNMQPAFMRLFPGRESISSADLPRLAGVNFEFRAHEALDDAKAIATALSAMRLEGRL